MMVQQGYRCPGVNACMAVRCTCTETLSCQPFPLFFNCCSHAELCLQVARSPCLGFRAAARLLCEGLCALMCHSLQSHNLMLPLLRPASLVQGAGILQCHPNIYQHLIPAHAASRHTVRPSACHSHPTAHTRPGQPSWQQLWRSRAPQHPHPETSQVQPTVHPFSPETA